MPIQFRCGSCNQLLGIATRKAGHVVNCPTCGNKTVVPRQNGIAVRPGLHSREQSQSSEGAAADSDEPIGISLLDRVDMDALLAPPTAGHPTGEMSDATAASREPLSSVKRAVEGMPLPTTALQELSSVSELEAFPRSPLTVVLTPTLTTVVIIVFIAMLASVLLLGMWLGSRFAV